VREMTAVMVTSNEMVVVVRSRVSEAGPLANGGETGRLRPMQVAPGSLVEVGADQRYECAVVAIVPGERDGDGARGSVHLGVSRPHRVSRRE
jgi:hypothetical protein